MHDYDVIVLGGGSAGTSAATAAARAGARTAMINDGELGGLCILRGCMPTKTMLASAHLLHDRTRAYALGVRIEGSVQADFRRIMERKNAVVERFKRAKIRVIESSDYEVVPGRARFAEGGGVEVDGRKLTARSYVIATGSVPVTLPIPGIDGVDVLDSDDVMALDERPRRLLVQGAGAVGLELGQFFARIGTEVLLVNRSPLLAHSDVECGEELARALRDEPRLDVVAPATIESVGREGPSIVAAISAGDTRREWRADAFLMATGRKAAVDDLKLERVGLEATDGRLRHDRSMRTSHPDIYVAGDVANERQVLHLANHGGIVAGHNAAGGDPPKSLDERQWMQVIFTDPPFAECGLSEQAAASAGRDVLVGRARFPETGRAITMDVRHGLWKLVADRESGEILGTSILGPHADDLVHLVSLMMRSRTRVSDIYELPWYHPTLSEVMLDLARDLTRQQDGPPAGPAPF